jgi:hypothetical protein
MKSVQATSGLWGVDILSPLTAEQYQALRTNGARWVGRYLRAGEFSLTAAELSALLGAGLLLLPIGSTARSSGWSAAAGLSDASAAIAAATSLALPAGDLWLDLEGTGMTVESATAYATAWAKAVQATGDSAKLYAGAGCPLDGAALYALPHTGYWCPCSEAYYPTCGYQIYQAADGNGSLAGIEVDLDMIQKDRQGRLPILVGP